MTLKTNKNQQTTNYSPCLLTPCRVSPEPSLNVCNPGVLSCTYCFLNFDNWFLPWKEWPSSKVVIRGDEHKFYSSCNQVLLFYFILSGPRKWSHVYMYLSPQIFMWFPQQRITREKRIETFLYYLYVCVCVCHRAQGLCHCHDHCCIFKIYLQS